MVGRGRGPYQHRGKPKREPRRKKATTKEFKEHQRLKQLRKARDQRVEELKKDFETIIENLGLALHFDARTIDFFLDGRKSTTEKINRVLAGTGRFSKPGEVLIETIKKRDALSRGELSAAAENALLAKQGSTRKMMQRELGELLRNLIPFFKRRRMEHELSRALVDEALYLAGALSREEELFSVQRLKVLSKHYGVGLKQLRRKQRKGRG